MSTQTKMSKYSFEMILSFLLVLMAAFYLAFPTQGLAEIETADSMSKKVMGYYDSGNYQKAFPLARKVLKIRERTLRPDHPEIAIALQTLAGLYQAVGDYENAAPLDKRALEILEGADSSSPGLIQG